MYETCSVTIRSLSPSTLITAYNRPFSRNITIKPKDRTTKSRQEWTDSAWWRTIISSRTVAMMGRVMNSMTLVNTSSTQFSYKRYFCVSFVRLPAIMVWLLQSLTSVATISPPTIIPLILRKTIFITAYLSTSSRQQRVPVKSFSTHWA